MNPSDMFSGMFVSGKIKLGGWEIVYSNSDTRDDYASLGIAQLKSIRDELAQQLKEVDNEISRRLD